VSDTSALVFSLDCRFVIWFRVREKTFTSMLYDDITYCTVQAAVCV